MKANRVFYKQSKKTTIFIPPGTTNLFEMLLDASHQQVSIDSTEAIRCVKEVAFLREELACQRKSQVCEGLAKRIPISVLTELSLSRQSLLRWLSHVISGQFHANYTSFVVLAPIGLDRNSAKGW